MGLLLWLFLVDAGLCRRARPVSKLERPAAARTNELDAGKRQPRIGSEDSVVLLVGASRRRDVREFNRAPEPDLPRGRRRGRRERGFTPAPPRPGRASLSKRPC